MHDPPPSGDSAAPSLIVGVGASAGGLEPLERLFAAMPSDTGMAFVVLQHLSPDFESRMDKLLGRQTRMPILRATDGIQVEPDRIYLVPPHKEMIVSGGRLLLTDMDDTRGFSFPIDHFFGSLAHDGGRRAVAIVLSGAGSDGSRGIREIHDAGGLVLCEVPEAARFQGMPLSARRAGVVDAFLPPEEMPAAILRYLSDPARSRDEARQASSAVLLVSELRRSEADVRRLSAIVESSGDAIFAKDANGKISGWNHGAESLYGWSAEEAMTRDGLFMVGPDKRAEAAEKLLLAGDGQVLQPYETVHLHKDGSPIDVSISHSPIYDEHDQVIGTSSIARDVTQKKRDEAEARSALHLRDQFMAMLSHELRNPLAALLNAAALLEKANGNGDPLRTQRALQTIERQCRHMARLLDDLLDVSRMRQDDIELRRTELDLRATVEAALERVRPMADAAEVAISAELPIEPVEVYGDADRLQQIEVNLLTNAVNYSPAGRGVRLSLVRETGEAVLRVSDDGSGIPQHMLERIFEPFVRAADELHGDGANRKRVGGMGLGLALVRSFVTAHDGDVRAHSRGLGQGAEFVVRLPLAKTIGRPVQLEGGPARESGESIVLVEDQDDNRMLLSDILADAGYVVLPASDGRQALELIERENPAVAVVDIGLPDLSGYDVAQEVRGRLRRTNLFLVALTGYGQQQDREAVLRAGFDQHLVKPVDISTLLDVLRSRKSLRGSVQWATATAQAAVGGRP